MAKVAQDPSSAQGARVDEPRNNNNPQNHTQPIFTQGLDYNIQTPYVNPQNNTTPQNGVPDVISGADAPLPRSNDTTAPPTTPAATPNNGGAQSGGGGTPSGGGYSSGGGGGTPSVQQELVAANVEAGNPVVDNTNYLLEEYNRMNEYQQQQEQLVKDSTQELINLANAQIDQTVAMQIRDYTAQLDQAKQQYSQVRAKLEQMKATEADNLALQRAANGDRGGVGQAQYSAQMQQRDQALYEIDLAQVNLEQEIERAIADAQATGNYQKLGQQLELLTAQYEQLYNLASQVMQTKTSDAAQLDQYYLQVEQLEQNTIINKINAGITVTASDMEQFGLTGADAQSAANAINQSAGIERQMLAEQLKSLQNANNAYSYGGGGGYYGGGSGSGGGTGGDSGATGGGFLNEQQLQEIDRRVASGTLPVYKNDGSFSRYFDGSTMSKGEYFVLSDGTKVYYNGSQLVSAADYGQQSATETADTNSARDAWLAGARNAGVSGGSPNVIYNNAKKALDNLIAEARIRVHNEMLKNGVTDFWPSANQITVYMNANEANKYAALNNLINSYNSSWS